MKKNDEGFTLIELLIVIVILGILAAVVVFAVGGITDKGEVSACKADLKTVEVAAEAYYAQEGNYPDNISSLLTNGTGELKLLNNVPKYIDIVDGSGGLSFVAGLDASTAELRSEGCDPQ
jgi:prepilin-type N-terminal cleavage/methylation domain-containing protein